MSGHSAPLKASILHVNLPGGSVLQATLADRKRQAEILRKQLEAEERLFAFVEREAGKLAKEQSARSSLAIQEVKNMFEQHEEMLRKEFQERLNNLENEKSKSITEKVDAIRAEYAQKEDELQLRFQNGLDDVEDDDEFAFHNEKESDRETDGGSTNNEVETSNLSPPVINKLDKPIASFLRLRQSPPGPPQTSPPAFVSNDDWSDDIVLDTSKRVKSNDPDDPEGPSGGGVQYRGVSRQQHSGKWTAQISINCKKSYLGTFDTVEEAAQAYDEAAIKHHGLKKAKLNFPKIHAAN